MTDHLHDRLVAAVGDHYLIEAELGRGGMAAVFRALDLRLNRRVGRGAAAAVRTRAS